MNEPQTKQAPAAGLTSPRRPRIGLALGSGSARGLAHIGVLRALKEGARVPSAHIESLLLPFAAVAADLMTGESVAATAGDLTEAVRASIAVPGIVTPVRSNGRILVDGGLVNPVPVSVARAMGADRTRHPWSRCPAFSTCCWPRFTSCRRASPKPPCSKTGQRS